MIKIDGAECTLEGNPILLTTEIEMIFFALNHFFDGHSDMTEILEEMAVCNEPAYFEMQKLMVRLSKAHDRAVEHKKKKNLKF